MTLPRFFDRLADAATPLLGGLDRGSLRARLEQTTVALNVHESWRTVDLAAAYDFAANLLARIYPIIQLSGPPELVERATNTITLINPRSNIVAVDGAADWTLQLGPPSENEHEISVAASGWNVFVDSIPPDTAAIAPAALLAATAVGVGEVFRAVFRDELGDRGRTARAPWAFNLITLASPTSEPCATAAGVDVGGFALVGAGAIGQAALLTLIAHQARGRASVIDAEKLTLSNLQRYVLTCDSDIGELKTELAARAVKNADLEVVQIAQAWDANLVVTDEPVLTAVDSAETRIAVQASLPASVYNAYTQPADLGWSRHERFGEDACLACVYWPDRRRPHRHEMVAEALRQHPLRVLAYLATGIPAGVALPPGAVPVLPEIPAPPDADEWAHRSILEDVAAEAGVSVGDLVAWRSRPLADLYQEGICGGGLLETKIGDVPHEALVPLAHQSALAGIMLAVQLIAAKNPDLREHRPAETEGRYDVLAGPPQILGRLRRRTDNCLCSDAVFLDVYAEKFGVHYGAAA
jgi:hypothetical protein